MGNNVEQNNTSIEFSAQVSASDGASPLNKDLPVQSQQISRESREFSTESHGTFDIKIEEPLPDHICHTIIDNRLGDSKTSGDQRSTDPIPEVIETGLLSKAFGKIGSLFGIHRENSSPENNTPAPADPAVTGYGF